MGKLGPALNANDEGGDGTKDMCSALVMVVVMVVAVREGLFLHVKTGSARQEINRKDS